MRKRTAKVARALAAASLSVSGLLGCAGLESRVDPDFAKTEPSVVAVLPFEAVPGDADAQARLGLLRLIFSANFSNLGYHPMALDDVDQRLRRAQILTPAELKAAGWKKLGEILDADAIVFGDQIGISSVSTFLFYRRQLYGHFTLVSTRTGRALWEARNSESATGGVVLDSGQLVQAVSDSIDAGIDTHFLMLAQSFSRVLVTSIPRSMHDEVAHDVPPLLRTVTVTVHGSSPLRSGDWVEVVAEGDPGLRGRLDLKAWHLGLPLVESRAGVYRGLYTVLPGESASDVSVSARLVNRFGTTARREASGANALFSVDAVPPAPPQELRIAKNGSGIEVEWLAPQGKPAATYRVFRATTVDAGFALIGSTSGTRFVDSVAVAAPLYQVVAVDAVGNVSFPAGPATLPARSDP